MHYCGDFYSQSQQEVSLVHDPKINKSFLHSMFIVLQEMLADSVVQIRAKGPEKCWYSNRTLLTNIAVFIMDYADLFIINFADASSFLFVR